MIWWVGVSLTHRKHQHQPPAGFTHFKVDAAAAQEKQLHPENAGRGPTPQWLHSHTHNRGWGAEGGLLICDICFAIEMSGYRQKDGHVQTGGERDRRKLEIRVVHHTLKGSTQTNTGWTQMIPDLSSSTTFRVTGGSEQLLNLSSINLNQTSTNRQVGFDSGSLSGV